MQLGIALDELSGRMAAAAAGYDPDGMAEWSSDVQHLAPVLTTVTDVLRILHTGAADLPVNPAATTALAALIDLQADCATAAAEIHATFVQVHAVELARLQAPRRGEHLWDVATAASSAGAATPAPRSERTAVVDEHDDITAQSARAMSDADLRAHRRRLSDVRGPSGRGGTPIQREQYRILRLEEGARDRAAARRREQQQRQAAPAGAVEHAQQVLAAGGIPQDTIDVYLQRALARGWTGPHGEALTDQYWARQIRTHRIGTGDLPTRTGIKAQRAASLPSRARRPELLVRKYWPDTAEVQERLDAETRHGREAEWRQAHPAQAVLLDLTKTQPVIDLIDRG